MERDRLATAALTLAVVLVVGLAAGSVASTTPVERGGGAGFMSGNPQPAQSTDASVDTSSLLERLIVTVLVVFMVVGVLVDPRMFFGRVAGMAITFGVVVALAAVLFLTQAGSRNPEGQEFDKMLIEGTREAIDQPGLSQGPQNTSPTLLFVIGAVLVAVFVVLALLTGEGSSRLRPGGGVGDGDEDSTLAAVGRSAGRAAERLVDTGSDVDNEVYRAWREMTDHLDVDNPGARTPGEFRAAALDAGMTRADVDVLTDLFEAVRYGNAPATDDREANAVRSLRRIERRYAAGEDEQ